MVPISMFVLGGLTPSGENSVGVEYERRETDSRLKSVMPYAELRVRGIGTLLIQHVNLLAAGSVNIIK